METKQPEGGASSTPEPEPEPEPASTPTPPVSDVVEPEPEPSKEQEEAGPIEDRGAIDIEDTAEADKEKAALEPETEATELKEMKEEMALEPKVEATEPKEMMEATPAEQQPTPSPIMEVDESAAVSREQTAPMEVEAQPTPSSYSTQPMAQERTQEELKAIEALEELGKMTDFTSAEIVAPPESQPGTPAEERENGQVPEPEPEAEPEPAEEPKDVSMDRKTEESETEQSKTPAATPAPVKEESTQELTSTPIPAPTRAGKRKAADVDLDVRDRKKPTRADSVLTEDDDTGPGRRRSKAADSSNVNAKRFQAVIGMLHSQISQHRNGNIFHNPIKDSEAPDYHEIIYRPMDLKTIKTKVKDGAIGNSDEYQRDIYLMFANAAMYNRPNSDIYRLTQEMLTDSEEHLRDFRQTEGFMSRGKR